MTDTVQTLRSYFISDGIKTEYKITHYFDLNLNQLEMKIFEHNQEYKFYSDIKMKHEIKEENNIFILNFKKPLDKDIKLCVELKKKGK